MSLRSGDASIKRRAKVRYPPLPPASPAIVPLRLYSRLPFRLKSSIWAASGHLSTTSLSVVISSRMNTSSCRAKLLRPHVYVPTNMSPRRPEGIPSISGSACTPSTSSASTKCCHALVPIGMTGLVSNQLIINPLNASDFKRVCVAHGANPTGQ